MLGTSISKLRHAIIFPTMKKLSYISLLISILLLCGCQSAPEQIAASSIPDTAVMLTPYLTRTPPPPIPTAQQTPGPLPQPSPTPRTHVVEPGESLGSLALRYGVTIPALLAANPDINPNAMSVGIVLVIPAMDQNEAQTANRLPLPTPVPIDLSRPVCYPTGDGGAFCMLQVVNRFEFDLESVSAILRSRQMDGSIQETKAFSVLNRIPAGESGILTCRLTNTPLDGGQTVDVELLSALPSPDDGRYPPVRIEAQQTTLTTGQKSALITGKVVPETAVAQRTVIRVGAAALDASGALLGVRLWENQTETLPETGLEFEMTVYALSGKIDRIHIWAEALRD